MDQVQMPLNKREVAILLQASKCLLKVKQHQPTVGDFTVDEHHDIIAKLGDFWEGMNEDNRPEAEQVKDQGRG